MFVDSGAWFAVADPGDRWHLSALRRLQRLVSERKQLLTTNHVVSETYTLMRVRLGPVPAQEFLIRSRASAFVTRLFVAESWEQEAEQFLLQYTDQDFSYVDAVSFVTMRRLGVQEAFAYDHHFATAGFTLLQ